MNTETIRLLLADDHPVMREGIRAILEKTPDIEVVGEAQDGEQVKPLVLELRPQILLLDLRMPGPPPAELEAWVREHCPETDTLVLTAHERDAYLAGMMDAGAVGLMSKEASPDQLIEAIRRTARGEMTFTPEQCRRAARWRREAGEKWKRLTPRERQMLALLAQGLENAEIAQALGLASKTVASHVGSLLKKLGVDSRQEAIIWQHTYMPEE